MRGRGGAVVRIVHTDVRDYTSCLSSCGRKTVGRTTSSSSSTLPFLNQFYLYLRLGLILFCCYYDSIHYYYIIIMLGNYLVSHKFVHLLHVSLCSNLTRHHYHYHYRHPVCSRTKFKLKDERLPCFQFLHPLYYTPGRRCLVQLKVHATAPETDQPKWWEKHSPNMLDILSTQEFVDALSQAGDRLVIVDFYGTWCASCRALFPKLCKLAQEHPEILFLKVNFDENKSLCKSLNIKVLPYFHFYRGADRLLDSFSCSLAKIQKLKDAIAAYNVTNCSAQISLKDNEDASPNRPP